MTKITRISKKFLYTALFIFATLSLCVATLYPMCCGGSAGCCGASRCGDCGEIKPICCNSICHGYPFYLTRSQGRNAARELAGYQQFINQDDRCEKYGAFYAAVQYERSFWPEQIARYLFGDDYVNCRHLYIQGSQVQNRHKKAWLADYFGLAPDYKSQLTFCPKIQNAILDLDFYLGLDQSIEGLYLNFNFPIAWTKWELNPCETICTDSIQTFSAGYMAEKEVSRTEMSKSFLGYMNGNTFGDMKTPIRHSKILPGSCSKTRLVHFRGSLGYNFALDRDYHFGVFAQLLIPGGNRPCAQRLFEPIIGNGKHFEIGGGLTGSWIFHRSCEREDKYLGVWFNTTLTHLIDTHQCRTFDLLCKPSSRYILLEDMGANSNTIQGGADLVNTTTITTLYQYKKNLIPAANITTWNVDVRHDVQIDFAAKLGYVHQNWSVDLGYNFWALTGGKFELDCCACRSLSTYAIKGDSHLYGKTSNNGETIFPLSISQSLADIHSGKNYPKRSSDTLEPEQNPRVDNPRPALQAKGTQKPEKLYSLILNNEQINTSADPVIISRRDINLEDAPTAITHKVFAHVEYASNDCETVIPFVGVGGQVEFAKNKCHDNSCACSSCSSSCCSCGDSSCSGCSGSSSCSHSAPSGHGSGCSCNSCNQQNWECDHCCDTSCNKRAGTSQWGIWLKGGLSFD